MGKEFSGPAKSWVSHSDKAQVLKPHEFAPHIETRVPTIYILPRVLNDMYLILDEGDTEISWLGLVDSIGSDFLITEIFMPKQKCHSTETEMTEEGISEIGEQLLARPKGTELVNKLRFWGHSHPNMGVEPSGQDETQLDRFKDNDCDYFIRGIFNTSGKGKFTYFDYRHGIKIIDVPWAAYMITDHTRRKIVKEEIKAKVTRGGYAYSGPSGSYHGYGSPGYVSPYQQANTPPYHHEGGVIHQGVSHIGHGSPAVVLGTPPNVADKPTHENGKLVFPREESDVCEWGIE